MCCVRETASEGEKLKTFHFLHNENFKKIFDVWRVSSALHEESIKKNSAKFNHFFCTNMVSLNSKDFKN